MTEDVGADTPNSPFEVCHLRTACFDPISAPARIPLNQPYLSYLPEDCDKLHRFQYLPFSAGSRICIGATFARQEAVIALAVLMKRFRFDMTPETNPWPVQRLTTQPKGGLPMRVSAR